MHRVFVLLLSLWPFHHHKAQPENVSTITVVGATDASSSVQQNREGCDTSPEVGFVWAGDDGMVGTSFESCEKAFQIWRRSPPPLSRMGLA